MKIGWIYILRLENSKWYVGWTNDPRRRLGKHFYNPSVQWVKESPPIAVAYQFYGTIEDETSATLQLAHIHGIANVRGGAYAKMQNYYQENLPKPRQEVIGQEFWLDAANWP